MTPKTRNDDSAAKESNDEEKEGYSDRRLVGRSVNQLYNNNYNYCYCYCYYPHYYT